MMEATIREIVRRHSGLGEAAADLDDRDDLWQLGMTSLASVSIMVEVEKAFGIEFPDGKLRHATFGSIYNIRAAVKELTEGLVS